MAMRPSPTEVSVLPITSTPSNGRSVRHCPALVRRSRSGILFARAKISAICASATARLMASGVSATSTSAWLAAAMSIASKPTPQRAMQTSRSQSRKLSAVNREPRMMTPS